MQESSASVIIESNQSIKTLSVKSNSPIKETKGVKTVAFSYQTPVLAAAENEIMSEFR